MALDLRPAEYFARFHERARTRNPDYIYSLARILVTPLVWFPFRTRAIDTENVPEQGPVILAPNHFSLADHFILGLFLRRKVRFMAKSELFKWPLNFILSHGGTFPVKRNQSDMEAIITAESILDRGQVLGIYAEGSRSRVGKVGRPHRGLGRLAVESGAPVVPVAIHGSKDIKRAWQLSFPKVTVHYGEPLVFERATSVTPAMAMQAADAIFVRVREMYDTLEKLGRRGVIRTRRKAARRTLDLPYS